MLPANANRDVLISAETGFCFVQSPDLYVCLSCGEEKKWLRQPAHRRAVGWPPGGCVLYWLGHRWLPCACAGILCAGAGQVRPRARLCVLTSDGIQCLAEAVSTGGMAVTGWLAVEG